jgi:hypothetical protein
MNKMKALSLANELNRGQVESVESCWMFVATGNRGGYDVRKYIRIETAVGAGWRFHSIYEAKS